MRVLDFAEADDAAEELFELDLAAWIIAVDCLYCSFGVPLLILERYMVGVEPLLWIVV